LEKSERADYGWVLSTGVSEWINEEIRGKRGGEKKSYTQIGDLEEKRKAKKSIMPGLGPDRL